MTIAEPMEAALPDRPRLAPDVRLHGRMEGTGFVDSQWLVQRDGRFVQLTELLYRVAEQADGSRTLEEIAEHVTDSTEWLVTGDDVRQLIEKKLIPAGIVASDDGTVVRPESAGQGLLAPLSVGMRMRTIGPRAIEPVTSVLQYLFWPPILVAILVAAAAAHVWLYASRGLTAALIDALYTPSFLLVAYGLLLVAGVFHEFGHASALRYGGGHVRGMGAGFYLVFPALYTDVTDSYRLGRWARVRTGLGGVYFHIVFALGLIAAAVAFRAEFLLIAVFLINVEVVRQFIPFVRLDGYWVVADLTGVPDFLSQAGPFLRSLAPNRMGPGPRLPRLKRWVQVAFLTYLVVTTPLLFFFLFLLVRATPKIVTVTWDAWVTQLALLEDAVDRGNDVAVGTALLQLALLGLTFLALGYIFFTLIRSVLKGLARTQDRRLRGAGVLALGAAVVGIAFMWAPALPFAAEAPPAGVEKFTITDRRHVTTRVAYAQSPPVGGAHAPVVQNCGFYSKPIRPENAVHSLEHGAVWLTFRPGIEQGQVSELRRLADRDDQLLVSPYRGLSAPIVASAWGRQLRLVSARDARLERFINVYRNSRNAPERNRPCAGGRGTPR